MLASDWEKEEAVFEGIDVKNNLLPQSYVVGKNGLEGIKFQHLTSCYDENMKWQPQPSGEPDEVVACDTIILAIGQDRAFPFLDIALDKDDKGWPKVDANTYQSSHQKIFFGGDAAFGPSNIISAVADGHKVAVSIHLSLSGKSPQDRPKETMTLESQKMGLHEWSYGNEVVADERHKIPHLPLDKRFDSLKTEVETGFELGEALKEAERCFNCDVQTVFEPQKCIECDACLDICPVECLTITQDSTWSDLRERLRAPAVNENQDMYVSSSLPQTERVMVKDENFCLHCGLCAERCPTAAWDMQQFKLNISYADSDSNGK